MKLHSSVIALVLAKTSAQHSLKSFTSSAKEALTPIEKEVCVVGGGPAGVYGAHLLEEKGYTTALFDEGDSLGGKTNPAEDDTDVVAGDSNSMFRHILTLDMTLVVELIDKFGLEDRKDLMLDQNFHLGYSPFAIFPRPNDLTPVQAEALQRYVETWYYIESSTGVLTNPNHEGVPQELMVPAMDWFTANNLLDVSPLIYSALTNYGYSFFQEIPIIYLLKYISPQKLIEASDTWFPMHLIFEELGSSLSDVNLDTKVKKIEQPSGDGTPWELSAKSSSGTKLSYKCEHVVLAFPPTMKGVNVIKGLHSTTKNLFTNIRTVSYWEGIISDLPECTGIFTNCLAAGNLYFKAPTELDIAAPTFDVPNVYYRRTSNSKAIVLFNGGDQDFDEEDFFDNIRGHLHAAFGYEPESYTIERYQKWSYFPHVGTQAMQNGFYNDLEDLQGDQNLYFTGGFRDFELVDNSMRTTKDLLDRYFPEK